MVRHMDRTTLGAAVLVAALVCAPAPSTAQSRTSSIAPPARFVDPDRLGKLPLSREIVVRVRADDERVAGGLGRVDGAEQGYYEQGQYREARWCEHTWFYGGHHNAFSSFSRTE